MSRGSRGIALALAGLVLAGCGGRAAAPRRRLALAPCRVKGIGAQTLCGTLSVPEDRQAPHGRQIPLRIAVVPALAPEPAEDPLFLLAGGPGQGAVEAVGPVLPAFERVRRQRDLVLVDQRGTGASSPLECEMTAEGAPLAEKLSSEGFRPDALRKCLAGYQGDPRQYTTPAFVADLDAVRDALGYPRVNLWGASYGTRAALAYMQAYPSRVRSAVLDGVAPYANRLPLEFAKDGQRSLDLLFRHCAADAACARTFPGLADRFQALLARLRAGQERVSVTDPATGQAATVVLGADAFTSGLRGVLYLPDLAALVPLMIDRATRGDYSSFVAATVGLEQGFSKNMSMGLFLSVVCAEDVPFIAPGEAEREAEGTFLGPVLARQMTEACAVWPHAPVPARLREPVRSDAPTLLLSGELDPATPPRWAAEAARTLPRSVQVVVPGVGHGATTQGCVPDLIAAVVDHGSVDGLAADCVARQAAPPFFVTFAGSTP